VPTIMSIEEMRKHEWVISWSGGKDSTVTIILCHKYGIPIKKIVYVRMMYNEDLPATLPVMVEFVDRAKEVFESWGYPVEIVKGVQTAQDFMNKVYFKSKYEYKNGNPYGVCAFCRGSCKFTGVKSATIKKCSSGAVDYEMIGYASDEEERLIRLTDKKQSIMVTLGIKEADTFGLCTEYNLLSPLYGRGFGRDGCWFCPNAAKAERAYLVKNHPELIKEIVYMIEMCGYDVSTLSYRNHWVEDYYKGKLKAK
jgi:3'-phosphoadenosine 5'-phosphosulfate sulfotransferase (PAPS reductase)/FAD synthetase